MQEQEKYVLESYLITSNDYADFQVAARRLKTGRWELFFFRAAGMALILASLLGRIYFNPYHEYNNVVYFLAMCLGVGICLYYDFCMPYIIRKRAFRYFNDHRKMVASHVEIDPMGIRFITEDGCEDIPYGNLCRAYEDKRVILLEEGQKLTFLPKRVLTMDEYKGVRKFLKRALKEKYLQEGVC